MFTAKNIMTTQVVTVDANDTIDEAIQLMVKHRISGLPVVDNDGFPLGIVSEFDLLELICEGHAEDDTVSRYMTSGLFGVTEEDNWVRVADMFREKHVRRLPVLRNGKLVGIVTRHDLVHAIRDARQRIRANLSQRDHRATEHAELESLPPIAAEVE